MTTKTALANLKQSKGRNLLLGLAIGLTALLIFSIMTMGAAIIRLKTVGIDLFVPSWEVMFRDVNQENADRLDHHADLKEIGRQMEVANVTQGDNTLALSYYNKQSFELNNVVFEEGRIPKAANEIALSPEAIKAFGGQVKLDTILDLPYQVIKSGGLDFEQHGTFSLSGIIESDSTSEADDYVGFISEAFAKDVIPQSQWRYRLMVKFTDNENLTVPVITAKGQKIGKAFGVKEADVVENSPYIVANYVDPSLYLIIGLFILIVMMAGVLTTYSIYYVSMIDKVQIFGKLKALGATKRQIRSIVFKEGLIIGGVAIPLGLLLGSGFSLLLFNVYLKQTVYHDQMVMLSQIKKFSVLQPWIFFVAAAISLFAMGISLIQPMWIASKISPVEA